jgi:hypothetical protein
MTDRPARQPELNPYEFPWYQRLPHAATDWWYGPDATAQNHAQSSKLLGTANPFNVPGNVFEGTDRMRDGWQRGDWGAVGGGALQAGASIAGTGAAVGTVQGAMRGAQSARNVLRENRAWEANTPRGMAMDEPPLMPTHAENLTKMRDYARRLSRGEKLSSKELAEAERLRENALEMEVKGHRRMSRDDLNAALDMEIPARNSNPFPTREVVSGAGGAAFSDWAWNGGIMPWNWNAPGTLQNTTRDMLTSAQHPDAENQPDGYYGHRPIPQPIGPAAQVGAAVGAGFGAVASPVATAVSNRLMRGSRGMIGRGLPIEYGSGMVLGTGMMGGIGAGLGAMVGSGRNIRRSNEADGEMLARMSPISQMPLQYPPENENALSQYRNGQY